MTESKRLLVYVVTNRSEPLGVFRTEFAALQRAKEYSMEWVQPIRVFELELDSFDYDRLCCTFQQGRRL